MSVEHPARHPRQPEAVTWPWPAPPDPGDLSRRVALRRAELKLTRQQVAARAGLSRRYLEYLERYPARPTPAALRQLAAALQTTPAALLGAGASRPPGRRHAARHPVLRELAPAECLRLLAPGGVGRVAFATTAGPAALPVNFAMDMDMVVFRTGPGTLLAAHAGDQVGFEADHLDEALAQGWSVLVHGRARRVDDPADLAYLQQNVPVSPWAGGARELYVRVTPERITGRRILADRPGPAPHDAR